LREVTLSARCGVAVDQAFPSGAIEQLDCALALRIRGIRGTRFLDCSAELRALGAIPDRCRARLPHVLFR